MWGMLATLTSLASDIPPLQLTAMTLGIGGFIGNLVMGLFLGWIYTRTRRVAPLVVAHAVIDIVAFVGYALAKDHVGWLT